MPARVLRWLGAGVVFVAVLAAAPAPDPREEAYRTNNVGVALLEQFKYAEAAAVFRKAVAQDPKLLPARVNLAIALFNVPDLPGATAEAARAAAQAPGSPHAHYVLGLAARGENRNDDALAAFQKVLAIDPRDVGSLVNLGQLHAQLRDYPKAVEVLAKAVEIEPYSVTATYNLALATTRSGKREDGQRLMQRFQALSAGGGTVIGQAYPDQGRYAEAMVATGAEPGLVNRADPGVTFAVSRLDLGRAGGPAAASDAAFGRSIAPAERTAPGRRALAASLGRPPLLFDVDGDGDLDLLDVGAAGQVLYKNAAGRFTEATVAAGLGTMPPNAVGLGAVAGDWDNDGHVDLFVLRYGASSLYRNDGQGRFTDVTKSAALPAYGPLPGAAAFLDHDHDGDLDLLLAGLADLEKAPAGGALRFPEEFPPAPSLLLRNNGNGTFADVTAETKLSGAPGHVVAVIPTDFDNRRDLDLVFIDRKEGPRLFRNLREGAFADATAAVGLAAPGAYTTASAADFDKDGAPDFFFGTDAGAAFASSAPSGFKRQPAPPEVAGVRASLALDYDNDGLLDLVALATSGGRLLRNLGNGWAVTSFTAPGPANGGLAGGDIDGDGDTDLVYRGADGALYLARNEGGSQRRSFAVRLAGKVSNRSAVGAKVDVRAGSLWQRYETASTTPPLTPADLVIGLGTRNAPDAVRVLWPAGILQAETELGKGRALIVTELDRKPSSCPYLYAWNGEGFEFITDFMGGGEMGYWAAPGVRSVPDPDEYVRIRGDQLREKDGRYELRVTNELEEVLYLDRFELLAVHHPKGVDVFPNEGMVSPPGRDFRLFAVRDPRPPRSAVDEAGRDVLEALRHMDRRWPDGFRLHRIRGYADEHSLILDLGPATPGPLLLLLTGWTDYAFSSDNVAAHQAGLVMSPPRLEVRGANGTWQVAVPEVGVPVGRPQTVVLDLTGKFPTGDRQVRIVTNMRIYWDQILVDDAGVPAPVPAVRLDPARADLRWRGFSAEVTPDGKEPFGYDYDRVSGWSPWKVAPGRYTREGDVRELLSRIDDRFVVSRPGDEVVLSFDAANLPPPREGWTRTFLFHAHGYSKEMDIHSSSPDQVTPLPFRAMTAYPYAAPEAYPDTDAHRAYLLEYNTRVVAAPYGAVAPQVAAGVED